MRRTIYWLCAALLLSCGGPATDKLNPGKPEAVEDTTVGSEESADKKNTTSIDDPKPSPIPKAEGFTWDDAPIHQALTADEKAWIGSMVAEVNGYHLNTGGVAFANPNNGKDLVENISEAIDKDMQIKDKCIWLEFYKDHTGFWFSCLMLGNGPQMVGKKDIFSGKDVTTGVMFNWYVTGKELRIRFEEELEFTYVKDTARIPLRTRYWTVKLPSSKPKASFSASDYFPEYDYTLPSKTKYEWYEKQMNGKPTDYESSTMF